MMRDPFIWWMDPGGGQIQGARVQRGLVSRAMWLLHGLRGFYMI